MNFIELGLELGSDSKEPGWLKRLLYCTSNPIHVMELRVGSFSFLLGLGKKWAVVIAIAIMRPYMYIPPLQQYKDR